jgi:hypothetical protein
MKSVLTALLVCASCFCLNASAQNEAIPFYNANPNNQYLAFGGAGFVFVPTVPIEITALGFNSFDLANSPYLVSLYNFNGSLLSSATVSTGSSFLNQTYYQSITPVILPAFSTNFIDAAEVSNPNTWYGGSVGNIGGGSFTASPDITYVAGAVDFSGGVPLEQNPGDFFVDENFQFSVVPEPTISCLAVTGLLAMVWHRRQR